METKKKRRETKIRTRRPEASNEKSRKVQEALQNMLSELFKCQQTRHCPGKDGLRLWCGMPSRNNDMPKSASSAFRLQRHQGHGTVIVVQSDLSKTVSSLNLDNGCTSSHELQGIRIEKPNERYKSLIFINVYVHHSICTAGASWDFLEQMGDELGDTIMICGDFNARSMHGIDMALTRKSMRERKHSAVSFSCLCQHQPPHTSVRDRVTLTAQST